MGSFMGLTLYTWVGVATAEDIEGDYLSQRDRLLRGSPPLLGRYRREQRPA